MEMQEQEQKQQLPVHCVCVSWHRETVCAMCIGNL